MKRSIAVLLILLFVVCFTSCVDYTKYPSGTFVCDFPYFYYESSASGDYSAKIDYHGKRINANLYMIGEGFDLDISEILYDEEGEPYIDEGGIIAKGIWSLDKEGNLVLDFDSGSKIVLNKQ